VEDIIALGVPKPELSSRRHGHLAPSGRKIGRGIMPSCIGGTGWPSSPAIDRDSSRDTHRKRRKQHETRAPAPNLGIGSASPTSPFTVQTPKKRSRAPRNQRRRNTCDGKRRPAAPERAGGKTTRESQRGSKSAGGAGKQA
jgi:hypothetical protein